MAQQTVDFGTQRVSPAEKGRRVRGVFDSVADRYDLMNDLMSLTTHRLFKRMAVEMARLREGHRVLDLAGGTGDVAALAAARVGSTGNVVLADVNAGMMARGRDRVLDRGAANVGFVQADAESLPFADALFDATLIAFGLRNFTDKGAALQEARRTLKQDAPLVVLEFAKVVNPVLARAFAAFKGTWPVLGAAVAGSSQPYRYLVESIEQHPDQGALRRIMLDAGFRDVEYYNLAFGAAAIHRGFK